VQLLIEKAKPVLSLVFEPSMLADGRVSIRVDDFLKMRSIREGWSRLLGNSVSERLILDEMKSHGGTVSSMGDMHRNLRSERDTFLGCSGGCEFCLLMRD